ncbi:hypothetical protein HDV01_004864 [Terramyces sp. JEL0728]|nr:hypothetical protein HDV01_004864 [Terramyces sp. JEL0728]
MKFFGIDVSAFKLQRNETLVSIDTVADKDIPDTGIRQSATQPKTSRPIADLQFYKRPFNGPDNKIARGQFVVPKAPGLDNSQLKKRVTPLLNIKQPNAMRRANINSLATFREIGRNTLAKIDTPVHQRAKRDPLQDINSRWESMMEMATSSSITLVPDINNEKHSQKSRRSISFNETVTLHKISRIQDLIEEYDAFEEMNDEYGDEWTDSVDDRELLGEQQNEELLDLALEDLNQEYCPSLKSARNNIDSLKHNSDDEESVTSLGRGCPTPDRLNYLETSNLDYSPSRMKRSTQILPYPLYTCQTKPSIETDHLRELEMLFESTRYRNPNPITPIVSLSLSEEPLEPEMPRKVKFEWKTIFKWPSFKNDILTRLMNWRPSGKLMYLSHLENLCCLIWTSGTNKMKEYEIEKVVDGSTSYWICSHQNCRGSGKHFSKESSAKSHYTRTHAHAKHGNHTETEDEEEKNVYHMEASADTKVPEAIAEEPMVETDSPGLADDDKMEVDDEQILETETCEKVDSKETDVMAEENSSKVNAEMEQDLQAVDEPLVQQTISQDPVAVDNSAEEIAVESAQKQQAVDTMVESLQNQEDETLPTSNKDAETADPPEQCENISDPAAVTLATRCAQTENECQTDEAPKITELSCLENQKEELKREIEQLKQDELAISKEVGELSRYKSNMIAEKYLLSDEISSLQEIRNDLMRKVTKQEIKNDGNDIAGTEDAQNVLNMSFKVSENMDSQLQDIQDQYQITTDKNESLHKTIEELNSAYSNSLEKLHELETQKSEAEDRNLKMNDGLEKIIDELSQIKSEIKSSTESVEHLRTNLDMASGEKQKFLGEIASLQSNLEVEHGELAKLKSAYASNVLEYQELLETKSLKLNELNRQKDDISVVQDEICQIQNMQEQHESVLSQLSTDKANLSTTSDLSKAAELQSLGEEIAQLSTECSKQDATISELKNELERLNQTFNSNMAEIADTEQKIQEQSEAIKDQTSNISERMEQLSNLQAVHDSDRTCLVESETQIEKMNVEISFLQKEIESHVIKNESALLALESGQTEILILQAQSNKLQTEGENLVREITSTRDSIMNTDQKVRGYHQELEVLKQTAIEKAALVEGIKNELISAQNGVQHFVDMYLALFEEKKQCDTSVATLKTKLADIEQEIAQLKQEKDATEAKTALMENLILDIQASAERAPTIDQELLEKEKELKEIMAVLQPRLTRLEFIANSINAKQATNDTIQSDIDKMQSQTITMQFDIETNKMKLQALASELAEKTTASQKDAEQLEKFEKELKEINELVQQRNTSVSEFQANIDSTKRQAMELQQKHEMQVAELHSLHSEIEQKEKDINAIQVDIEQNRTRLMAINIEAAGVSSTLTSINAEIASNEEKLGTLNKELESQKASAAELESKLALVESDLKQAEDQKTSSNNFAAGGQVGSQETVSKPPTPEPADSKENIVSNIPHARVNSDSKLPKRSIPVPKTRLAVRKAEKSQEESKLLKKPKLSNE